MSAAHAVSRLRLRPPRRTDEDLFCSLYGDADTMKFIGTPLERRRAILKFAALMEANDDIVGPRFFAIASNGRAKAVGFCGIQLPDRRMRGAEIGIVLAACARGRGCGGSVLGALVDTAFASLPIDCVWVQYRPSNTAAERLFAGAGFRPVATRPPRVRQTQCIRALQRLAVCAPIKPRRGKHRVDCHQFS